MRHIYKTTWALAMALLSILGPATIAVAQTGTLTGVVISCYTGLPISYTSVICGAQLTQTNLTGHYTFLNVPAGSCVATAVAVGYLPNTKSCTIFPNQTTILNFCLNPIPGYLTGVITNCVTGDPVVGAKVEYGTYNFTYSTAGGHYLIPVYPTSPAGVLMAVTMPGFDTWISVVSGIPVPVVIPPNTVTFNVQITPHLYNPSNVVAMLNASQTAVDLSWNLPAGLNQLVYDDGIKDQCMQYMASGSISAVKFTPCSYPAVIKTWSVQHCVSSSTPGPNQVYVYKDDGPGGMPGTILAGPFLISNPGNGGFNSGSIPPVTLTSGCFYIGVVQGGSFPDCAGVAVDTTINQMKSFQQSGAGAWVPVGGNFMIRAGVEESCGMVPPANITYTVSRFLQGQEGNQSLWTIVDTTAAGITTLTDNSWPSLPCGPYRWAVKANYPCNGTTTPGLSNLTGKCWTAAVTFHSERCCAVYGNEGIRIQIHNIFFPSLDTIAFTDSTGTVIVPDLWKGNYEFSAVVFGCHQAIAIASITGDTSISLIMPGGAAFPPTGLYVNDTTLLATWNKPMRETTLINESWVSGNFNPNIWTISGGTNWIISTNRGNPAPSAEFTSSPQVTDYHQYLTSRNISLVSSPSVKLSYDILLDNYGTTTLNSMAIEIWDNSSWIVLKTYTNAGGNIPMTHETLELAGFTSNDFKIRFHAYGGDSGDINYWLVDNISIVAFDEVSCLSQYNFYINGATVATLPDTSYQIPPQMLPYGQPVHACVVASYSYNVPSFSVPVCFDFTSHFLYPPLNFTADSIDCSAYLSWQKPETSGGLTPAGLTGYNVYRDTTLIHYCPSPDSLSYVDTNPDPGNYLYSCEAMYDLSVYGFPGQTGVSYADSASDPAMISCGFKLPFIEGWNNGTFSFYDWTFDPAPGNWGINTAMGDPSPAADFSWNGKNRSTDYSYALVSPFIDANQWSCSNLWLDFDLKLIDRNMNSTEKMSVELRYDDTWHPVAEFVNEGSFGWETKSIAIDAARGKSIQIRFRAHGANTENFMHWYIDNISVYGVCLPPLDLQGTTGNGHINLEWSAPCTEITGYNIYRSDFTGNPPFIMLNAYPVPETTYSDTPSGWVEEDVYRYYITALQTDHITNTLLCESVASDTIQVDFPTGIPDMSHDGLKVYPNPATDIVVVKSSFLLTHIQVINQMGSIVFENTFNPAKQIIVNTSGWVAGIYFIRASMSSNDRMVNCKMVKR